MARIPLAEIPNAPTGGKPALANPQFPSFEVGNQAVSQIREGYQSNMVDERAAGAMGRALQNVGQDMTQIGLEGMDAVVSYAKMAEKEATGQFLTNLTEVQSGMQQRMAAADPSMYPVIVKETYRDKNGQLNPQLLAGVSSMGRRYVMGDALRAEAKDMADYSLKSHLANLEQDEGRKLAAMQTLMTSGQYADAESLNDSLFATRRISPEQFASNKVGIAASRDNQTLMVAIQTDPEVMAKKLTAAMMDGKPLEDIKNISLESYPRYIKAAEYASTLQTAERLTTMTDLIDGKSIVSLDALRANPMFKMLDQEKQTALTRRLTNSTAGTPASEMAIKQTYNKLLSFPKTDKPWAEYATLATEATAVLVDPYFEPFMKKLNARVAEMAENGGVLAPSSKIEKYVADKLDLFASMGMFGKVPAKESGMEQSPEYVQQMLAIETAKMEKMQLFRAAGIKTQSEADEFLNSRLLPAEAKNAWQAEPNVFQRAWRSMFPSAPAKPDGSPVPAKTPAPRGTAMPTNEPPAPNPKSTSQTLQRDPNVNPSVYNTWDRVTAKYPSVANWGIWGDEAHKKRKSDHNTGDAIDIGIPDAKTGETISEDLVAMAGEQNIKYLIHNRRIWKPDTGWQPYKGAQDHAGHIHVSFNKTPANGQLVASR